MKTFMLIGFNSTTSASHCFCTVNAPDQGEAIRKLDGRFSIVKNFDTSARALFSQEALVARFTPGSDTWTRVANAEANMCCSGSDSLERTQAAAAYSRLLKKLVAQYDQFYVGQVPAL